MAVEIITWLLKMDVRCDHNSVLFENAGWQSRMELWRSEKHKSYKSLLGNLNISPNPVYLTTCSSFRGYYLQDGVAKSYEDAWFSYLSRLLACNDHHVSCASQFVINAKSLLMMAWCHKTKKDIKLTRTVIVKIVHCNISQNVNSCCAINPKAVSWYIVSNSLTKSQPTHFHFSHDYCK